MKNILSIFGILCVCFGIILNSALVSGTSFDDMLQDSGVLAVQPVGLPQNQPSTQPETQTMRQPVTQPEKPLANVEKKCTSRGMFCVPKSMCISGQIIAHRTNIGRTHNEHQTIECSLDKVCCSIPPMTEVIKIFQLRN